MTPTDTVMISLISFLSGGFLTAVGFVVGYSNRLTRVEDKIDAISKAVPGQCPLHTSLEKRIDELKKELSK